MSTEPTWYAFLDESTLYERANQVELVAYGGFVVARSELARMNLEFERVLRDRGVPIDDPKFDTEVKYSPQKGNFFYNRTDRHELFRDLLLGLAPRKASAVATLVYCGRIKKWTAGDARAQARTYVVERIEMLLRAQDAGGALFIDRTTKTKKAATPSAEISRVIQEGSSYGFRFRRLAVEVKELDSKQVVPVQLADLVVGCVAHMVRNHIREQRVGEDPFEHSKEFHRTAWSGLQGRFMRLAVKDPKRFGLRILPSWYEEGFVLSERPYPVD